MKKLKIFATSDLQGNSVVSKQLASRAEKEHADVVIIAGDILDFGQYQKNIIKPFVEKNERVLIVPGNHDTEDSIENFEKNYSVKNLHGNYVIIGDVGFFGCGGTSMPLFNYALSEEEIYKKLKKSFEKVKDMPKKVMVTHIHPSGGFVEKFTFPGSKGVRKAIDQFKPDVHISGHIHEMEGAEEKMGKTLVISVGARGKVVEL